MPSTLRWPCSGNPFPFFFFCLVQLSCSSPGVTREVNEPLRLRRTEGERGDVTPCLLISNSARLTSVEQIRPPVVTQVDVMAERHPCRIGCLSECWDVPLQRHVQGMETESLWMITARAGGVQVMKNETDNGSSSVKEHSSKHRLGSSSACLRWRREK